MKWALLALAAIASPAVGQVVTVPPAAGASVDLSGYATKAEQTAAIASAIASVPAAPVVSVNGATGAIISTKMQATSVGTTAVTNTTTETSIVGTMAAGSSMSLVCGVGKAYRLRVAGQFTTPLTPGNLTARVKINSTVIGVKVVANLLSLASNADWSGDVLIAFRSCGTSGTVLVGGSVTYDTGVQVPGAASLYNGVITLDTTVPMTVDATAQWATASTTRSIGTYLVSLEALN